ncbi:ISL3 family transposase [Arthrobacter sp. TS-15]|uniref:ISL3 family transposase n=1 Tax=Arthrobacter sp. TS-15 TaxID=2510797 RepID=UPI00115F38E0|nr:ISL3 family transposase [Arthrobacter sp. TS-15]TQS88265.1 ISL3 family transposase [Arthrobacter sp. TS-15]
MLQITQTCDAASILFNLEGHVVLSAEHAGDTRAVLVEPVEREGACPDCGVLSSRVQARPIHRVRDVQCGGAPLEVRVRKRRLACLEPECPRRSFVQTTDEIPLRSRLTSRLVAGIVTGLSTELRAVSRVAAAAGVSWTTVMRVTADTAVLDGGVDRRLVRRLGVDEHRFRRVRYLKDGSGKVTRVEPWSIVFTDLDTGAILDIVDGRRGQAVRDWLGARPRWWRNRVELVAMDMSTEFRRAVRKALPKAAITVDHWHVVARANQMVTEVRRRRAHDLHGRRGRATDPAWKYRKLLTCNQENMSGAQRGRMQEIIAADIELGVVWGIKEHVRQLLKTDHIDAFHRAWAELEHAVKATRMREAKSLFLTLRMWRRELLTFCRTRVTNARSEAANLSAKNLKRAARGYRNHDHYRLRLLLYTAAQQAC